ncbi:MAG: hypothetical protein IKW07_01875 [Clostridia bacterium]|nr:hypothetical protein [Clostridia bacterium]
MKKQKSNSAAAHKRKYPPYALTGSEEHTAEGYVRLLLKRVLELAPTEKDQDSAAAPSFYYHMHK